MFKMDIQQRPIVKHKELCSMSRASLNGRGVWGRMDPCIWMAESLLSLPETIPTLLVGYTPIENKKLKNCWNKYFYPDQIRKSNNLTGCFPVGDLK